MRDPSNLTIGWGRDLISGMQQVVVCYNNRCQFIEYEEADRDLGANAFYHRFIHPALRALAG